MKNAWLLPIFFLDVKNTCSDVHFSIIINRGKNTFELVGIKFVSIFVLINPLTPEESPVDE